MMPTRSPSSVRLRHAFHCSSAPEPRRPSHGAAPAHNPDLHFQNGKSDTAQYRTASMRTSASPALPCQGAGVCAEALVVASRRLVISNVVGGGLLGSGGGRPGLVARPPANGRRTDDPLLSPVGRYNRASFLHCSFAIPTLFGNKCRGVL